MVTFWRKIIIIGGYLLASIIILAALTLSTARLFMPLLNDHLTDFEKMVTQVLDYPVRIKKINVSWKIYKPELILQNVTLLDKKDNQSVLLIPAVKIDVAFFHSLIDRTIVLDSLKISGVQLTFHQQASGKVAVAGFSSFNLTDDFTGQPVNSNAVLTWIFSQHQLALEDFEIHYFLANGMEKWVTLKSLTLNNTSKFHLLAGSAILNQATPTSIDINLKWQGNSIDIKQTTADLSLSLEDFSLSQWLENKSWHNLQVLQGIGNAKILAHWEQNNWQKIQTTLELYAVHIASHLVKKEISIPRLSGQFVWQRKDAAQLFTGTQVLLDLPNHAWPLINFAVNVTKQADGTFALQQGTISYLDLLDSYTLLQNSGLLLADMQATVNILKPSGELKDFKITLQGPWDNLLNVAFSTQFSGLTFQQANKISHVKNLQGDVAWDGRQGSLNLHSQKVSLRMNDIFANSLEFDRLEGAFNWQKDLKNNTWLVNAKNIQINNLDLNANSNFLLTIPSNDASTIDLTGQFEVLNAAHVSRYLPLKIFSSDLVTWLQHAFLKGQVSKGEAIVRGRLRDFPFDQTKGKFLIQGDVKNVELKYAPDWPALQNLNGKIMFSSKSIIADVIAGETLNIPLQAIHGEISDLSTAPILNVASIIHSDFSQSLQFIQQTPLEATIGKNLAPLGLQGPMELDLKLSIPLDHPDDTKVSGHTTFTNANLNLSVWELEINKLSGEVNFTEKDVAARHITGELFNHPLTLDLATQYAAAKTSGMSANLQGVINTRDLQAWLHLPVEEIMQGTTSYQANVYLPTTSASQLIQVIINADLKGMAVHLPGKYGKTAEQSINFNLALNIDEHQPLAAKLNYNNLFSLAATLPRKQAQFSLLSGDVHLGAGDAQWQTIPGIIVTGHVDEIDWNKIQPYLTQLKLKNKTSISSFVDPELLRAVDLTTEMLNVAGLKLKNIKIKLAKIAKNYLLELNNADLAGQIILLRDGDLKSGIQARFQRLYISSAMMNDTQEKNILTPQQLPPIAFSGEDIRYQDMMFGQMNLSLLPITGGIAIKQLDSSSAFYQLQATGEWVGTKSHFQGKLTTKNLTELRKSWGFSSSNLVGSTGEAEFDLHWANNLFHPSLKELNGTITIQLGEGRIINLSQSTDAKMDLGRLLNIFSLQSLPRRLSLNFSDVFQKGYSFDSMKGDFILKDGNAFTKKINIKGPVAGIVVSGRIGLAAKDLDLKLNVTPYVTGSLPMMAAIATVNPVAGVATWVVDKMVSPAVSRLTTYRYSITGSWSDPIWNQISTQQGAALRASSPATGD